MREATTALIFGGRAQISFKLFLFSKNSCRHPNENCHPINFVLDKILLTCSIKLSIARRQNGAKLVHKGEEEAD